MAVTFVAGVSGFDSSGTPDVFVDASGTLNVATGDFLVGWGCHEGSSDTIAFNEDSGGAAFTTEAGDYISHTNNDLHGTFGWWTATGNNASFLPRMTCGSRPYRKLIVLQFRPDGGDTATKDGASENQQTVDTGLTSGDITTTGTDEIVIGACSMYTSINVATPTIDGVAATAEYEADNASAWYRILTGTMTGDASADASGMGNLPSIFAIIAFKFEAAGGGGQAKRSAQMYKVRRV